MLGGIQLVRTQGEGGEGVSKFCTNAYKGGGGVWPLSMSARSPEGRNLFYLLEEFYHFLTFLLIL